MKYFCELDTRALLIEANSREEAMGEFAKFIYRKLHNLEYDEVVDSNDEKIKVSLDAVKVLMKIKESK